MNRSLRVLALAAVTLPAAVYAQSTATLAGTVTDPSGAALPNAQILLHNKGTGTDRTVVSTGTGDFSAPSLAPGEYTVTVTAPGFANYQVETLNLQVDQHLQFNVKMALATAGQTVNVGTQDVPIESGTITVGQVIDRKTVQEIPLNGRHFLDLTTLTPGGVTAPANGFLTSPSRGLGSNSFVTAGNREDSVNFQINGVNLNDMVQNQITFQPSISTTSEFKIDNQTFSAEYGRSSGSIVNVATRAGTNQFHGEAFEYIRNNDLDARNYFNAAGTPMSTLKRSNFGASVGGPIVRDHTFFFVSYEGLRQAQSIILNNQVLTDAQRAGVTDPVAQKLLQFIPVANSTIGTGTTPNAYATSVPGPVQIDQGTADIQQVFSPKDTLHGFYALQEDTRTEPNLQGNNVPGFGDHRHAKRQILTVNETHVVSPTMVNDLRVGFNRIYIGFLPNTTLDPTTYGLNTGTTGAIGLPQFTISGPNTNFGGPAGFPQGRTDTLGVISDNLTTIHGKHSVKVGGEYRRFINANFNGDTGNVLFNSVSNFQQGLVTSFTITPAQYTSRVYVNALGAFAQDTWTISPRLTAELGFRFEWNGSPTAGDNRFVIFNPGQDSLQQVGTAGLGRSPYRQNLNYEPRVGVSYDVAGNGRTIVRAAFGYMADQPETNLVTGLASNPPFSTKVSYTSATAPLHLESMYSGAAAAGISLSAVDPNYRNAYMEDYNLNIQQEVKGQIALSIGYYGSQGHHLRQYLNLNQPSALGVRPFQALSTSSPIDPGKSIKGVNILESAGVGQSNYNAMWVTAQKNFARGLQFQVNYSLSKSMDLGSQTSALLEDSTRPYLNYGPSDFDTRHRVGANAVYNLPFKGNRLTEGFVLTGVAQWQTGNPLNVTTTSTYTGLSGVMRPNMIAPLHYAKQKVSKTGVQWFGTGIVCTQANTTPGCVFQIPTTGFGNMSRNKLTGPGFTDVDLSLEKNTRVFKTLNFQFRVDAFDIFNHPSFGNPSTVIAGPTTTSFGVISSTRFPVGDLGSSRQLQFAGKFTF